MKFPRYILLIVSALVIGAVSYFWGSSLMDSLYAYRSPLHKNPPIPGEAINTPLTNRVVLVLIDALRVDTAADSSVMPFLDELRQIGAYATMHSRPPSYSAPAYSVIFTGAWPDLSDGPALNTDYEDMPAWTQDNTFTAADRSGLIIAVSAYYYFQKLIPDEVVDSSFYTAGEDAKADIEVVNAAMPWLKNDDHDLILIHIDQVDFAGHHEGGPLDPRWNEAATRADAMVREIASELDLEEDTLLVFSDHGQIDAGGHGGNEPVVLVEPFIAAGKGIRPGSYDDIQMVDLAPTIAVLLGTNMPASSQGKVLTDMLVLTGEEKESITSAQYELGGALYSAYTQAIGRPDDPANLRTLEQDVVQEAMEQARNARLSSERLTRFILIGLILGIIGYALRKNRYSNFPWMFGAAILYGLFFHLRYAVIGGWTYSLSSIESTESLLYFVGTTTLVSLAIPWWIFFTYLGVFKMDPKRAAEITFQYIFAVILLLALPVFWHFAWNGAVVTWTIPDMSSMYFGFICLLQILFVTIISIPLSGLTALIVVYQRWLQPPANIRPGQRNKQTQKRI